MNKKYLCPKHFEKTPSAAVYGDGYFCFGCGAKGPVTDLGIPAGERIEVTYLEDIKATIAYIDTLPRKNIRGFSLPFNDRGYYLVYPNLEYYKFRLSDGQSNNKYRGPSGHKKPKFVAQSGSFPRLVLVEGEFNALSLAALELPWDVVSPGAAGDFYSKSRNNDLQEYAQYSRVDIVVDDDVAGLKAAMECSALLQTLNDTIEIKVWFVKEDFNETFTREGKEGLKKAVTEMGML